VSKHRLAVARVRRGIAAVALVACASCAPVAELSVRHEETGTNSVFLGESLGFKEYQARSRAMIAKTRLDLRNARAAQVVEANSPFELAPGAGCPAGQARPHAKGALLIHGLTDSPFQTRDIARFLNSRCFLVRSILLTGHGTVPGDLLSVDYGEWVKQTRWALRGLAAEVDAVVVVGFSTGGALALHAALDGGAPKALILFSPALKAKSRLDVLIPIGARVTRWLEVAPDDDYAKYESFSSNAAYQVYRLTGELEKKRATTPIAAPVCVALSAEDGTTDSEETLAYFSRLADPASRLVLYASGAPRFADARVRVVPAARPGERILEQSHISIGASPENEHYGRGSTYRNCKHYLRDAEAWKLCKTASPIPLGERGIPKPSGMIFARLTYNPDFAGLMRELSEFLDRVDARK
jgi:esterase/lipase